MKIFDIIEHCFGGGRGGGISFKCENTGFEKIMTESTTLMEDFMKLEALNYATKLLAKFPKQIQVSSMSLSRRKYTRHFHFLLFFLLSFPIIFERNKLRLLLFCRIVSTYNEILDQRSSPKNQFRANTFL